MYLISPFTFTILTRWPRLRRWFGPLGLVLAAVGFLMSSFATTVWQLIATQGVMCALGCGLLFTPTTLYLDEWFVKRKGLAYGIMWAGKSAAGVGIPFAMEVSLQRFGPSVTLQAWTVVTVRGIRVLLNCNCLTLLGPLLSTPPILPQAPHSTLSFHHCSPHQLELYSSPFILDAPNRQRPTVARLLSPLHLPLDLRRPAAPRVHYNSDYTSRSD